AIEDYTQAIQIDPNFASAYHNRGDVRHQLGDKQGGIDDFQTAADIYKQIGDEAGYKEELSYIYHYSTEWIDT
ncbi:tetratricopeptide repeat protein, partial [Aphanizomenon sp. UHCC 0183]|uniref:tetratricopeptide repeat protein n=1 Tax=Aphanizomenon sp. UHCC 0183 TaxID=2590028 RepID=UPI001445DEC7